MLFFREEIKFFMDKENETKENSESISSDGESEITEIPSESQDFSFDDEPTENTSVREENSGETPKAQPVREEKTEPKNVNSDGENTVTEKDKNPPKTYTDTSTAPDGEVTKKNKKKKKRFTLANELLTILLSVAFCFTVFFFSPVDIFVGNQHDFTIDAVYIFVPLLITASVASLVLIAVLNIILALHMKTFRVTTSIIFGVLLAFYCQMLFYNGKMVSMTGDVSPYSKATPYNIINIVVIEIIAFLPFIGYTVMKNFKKNKIVKKLKGNVVTYLSAVTIIMQVVGMAGQINKNGISKVDKSQYNTFFTFDEALNLSPDQNNVVVFLTDRLEGDYMRDALEECPELYDMLEGFTFYENHISCYTNTFPSIAQMLTNNMYQGEDWETYLDNSWAGQTVPRVLHDNGYKVSLILDNLTTFDNFEQLYDQCDNIRSSDDYGTMNYTDTDGIVPTMINFSLGKLCPYLLKSYFLDGYNSNFSNNFIYVKENIPGRLNGSIGSETDLDFYNYVKDYGIKADSEKPTFSFIHLCFAHDNDYDIAQLYEKQSVIVEAARDAYDGDPDDFEPTKTQSIMGGFAGLSEYFDQLKELGLYDNTTIVIAADHGRPPAEIEYGTSDRLINYNTASLIVKPAGAEHKPLQLNSDAELSAKYFPASLVEYAGVDHSALGTSYNDVINSGVYPPRDFHVYFFHGYGNVEDIMTYEVTGDACDLDNWKITARGGKPVTD